MENMENMEILFEHGGIVFGNKRRGRLQGDTIMSRIPSSSELAQN
jgi:hypothetical protein